MEKIHLKTPSFEGEIYIGQEVIEERLPDLLWGQKNFILTDSTVYALYTDWFKTHFAREEIFVLPAGEEHKNFQSLYQILSKMAEVGLHRNSRLFAVGGGVVGDIGGLAAALYMRGISCVQIPTTLLAQVDSSVGGKTAVDLGGVKNIVGAFYQPCEVLIDPTFLQTLPEREIKCGLGEIVKYAALNSQIFDILSGNEDKFSCLPFLTKLITACVAHKAQVVTIDEKERGERRSLNVGHTTGHAVELYSGLSHGESVLYGMKMETIMAMDRGVCAREYGKALLSIVDRALALAPQENIDLTKVEEYAYKARSDKKNTGDSITMSVAKSKGEWTIFTLPFAEYQTALKKATQSL